MTIPETAIEIRDEEIEVLVLEDSQYIEVSTFKKLFKGSEFNFTDLYNHENATDGWQETFYRWKQKGILN